MSGPVSFSPVAIPNAAPYYYDLNLVLGCTETDSIGRLFYELAVTNSQRSC